MGSFFGSPSTLPFLLRLRSEHVEILRLGVAWLLCPVGFSFHRHRSLAIKLLENQGCTDVKRDTLNSSPFPHPFAFFILPISGFLRKRSILFSRIKCALQERGVRFIDTTSTSSSPCVFDIWTADRRSRWLIHSFCSRITVIRGWLLWYNVWNFEYEPFVLFSR